jgi:polysaccharide export outer membrane protein
MMWLKIVFALVSGAALCCAQTEAPSAPSIPAPSNPPETNPNPTGQIANGQNAPATKSEPAPSVRPAPASQAPVDQAAPPSGKAEAQGRVAGAKPDSGHKAYVIGPLDVLSIKVWNNAQLSQTVSVDSDGLISLPLIEEVKADGLTVRQLKDKLVDRLRDFFNNNPDVDVTVLKVNSKRYFVYGAVGKGGEYPLIQETTVMDALSSVGGFAAFGNKKKIYILRGTQTFHFNYNEVSKGKHMEQNILIENGDRIFVPE